MLNSRQKRDWYILFVLNCSTTAFRIGSVLFSLGILFVLVVGLISGTTAQFSSIFGSPLHPENPPGFLSLFSLLFAVLFILIEIVRWLARDWMRRAGGSEKYLLTWKKLWAPKVRRAIIQWSWGSLQTIWVGLILAVAIPLFTGYLKGDNNGFAKAPTVVAMRWVFGPGLTQHLVVGAIVMFILLSFVLRFLAHNQPKEENSISVKELTLIHKSLEAGTSQLQALSQDFARRVLEDMDEHIIRELTAKMVEPLQQDLAKEQAARMRLEAQVQQLRQQTNPPATPTAPAAQPQVEATQKLNRPSEATPTVPATQPQVEATQKLNQPSEVR